MDRYRLIAQQSTASLDLMLLCCLAVNLTPQGGTEACLIDSMHPRGDVPERTDYQTGKDCQFISLSAILSG